MKADLRREVAAAALGGGKGTEPVEALLRKGLSNYRDVRLTLDRCGLSEAVRDLRKSKAGRDYIRVALRRGVTARIPLAQRSFRAETFDSKAVALVTIWPAQGGAQDYMDAASAARGLAQRAGTDVETALRIVLGIERARRRLYELCEEATRWL